MSDRIPSSEITPADVYFNRRTFIRGGIVAAGAIGTGLIYRKVNGVDIVESKTKPLEGLVPGPNTTGEMVNTEIAITNYNNFYEFTTNKDGVAAAAANFDTTSWKVEVTGLCHKPKTFDIDDIRKLSPPEERVYRFRCVEAWSMVIPWAGYSFSKLLKLVEPTSDAKYVALTTLLDPTRMPGQKTDVLQWPYVEGYRIDEAMNPLCTLTTGLYGKELPPQDGAPVRIIVPWKYGFKNIKSIVKIELVKDMPPTSWNRYAAAEYGFYGNVNPEHDHPRWSQATELRIGESARRKTLMFNGYADQVASLYAGMDLHANFDPATALELPKARVPQLPILDGKFLKWFAIISCAVPGVLLIYDAYRGMLGVNAVNFAIRSTGMAGLVMMSLSLFVTPIRRLTGWNALLSMRRNLGVYGFAYILTHFLIFFWFDREHDIGGTLQEILDREYLWYGFGSLLLMLPLAITSTDGMVTRLGPKRWKLLHRLAYPAVLAGGIHYYKLIKGADKTQANVFIGAFSALMLFRLVSHYIDLRREVTAVKDKLSASKKSAKGMTKKKFWTGELRVARIFDETHNVKTFRMVMLDGSPLPFEAISGQYINLMLTIDGKKVNRSYTIASSPTRHAYVEISVKRDGLASKYLHASIKEGDRIKVGAAAGKFHFAGHETDKVVLVAGGVGITPMMSVIRSLTDRGWAGEIYLLFVVKARHDVIFERELEYLKARHANLKIKITLTGDPEAKPGGLYDGAQGRLARDHVDGFVPDLKGVRVMLCGPEPQMKSARELFVGLGVPNDSVHEEAFASPPPAKDDKEADAKMMEPQTEAADAAGEFTVTFKRSDKQVQLVGLTVLEAAEENDVAIPFECRSGICGQCKCKLVSGRVVMESQDALTAGDKAKGLILACQARPVQNCEIEA